MSKSSGARKKIGAPFYFAFPGEAILQIGTKRGQCGFLKKTGHFGLNT